MRKKTLIITYYWPPAGGPGVQRWLKFVKYLPEFNIEPIVYVPEQANYPIIDTSFLNEVPKDVKIIKQPISEPYKWARLFSVKKSSTLSKGLISESNNQNLLEKLLLWVRGNLFIPDARIDWVKPSVKFLTEYITNERIGTIITTGPPHSMHLIGMQIKERLGVKWIADFRDPWTSIGYHHQLRLTKKSQLQHKKLEHQVLNSADQIIVTSFTTKEEFNKLTNKPIEVITNGYDKELTEKTIMDSKFSLSHIGSLLSKRNPEILWKVLSDLCLEINDFASNLQLNFVGFISEEVLLSINSYNLSDYVNNVGYVSHNKALKFQKNTQLLLLIEINSKETKCIIPGKLFEYMITNRPIVAIGPKGSDVETIIKETNSGNYFNYDDYNSLKARILNHYNAFKKGDLQSHPIGLQKYSRKYLTESLSKLI